MSLLDALKESIHRIPVQCRVKWECGETRCVGIERGNLEVGEIVLQYRKNRVHVRYFEVQEDYRRTGVGESVFEQLKRMNPLVTLAIEEENLDGQLFARAMGFRCYSIVKDVYLFRYTEGSHEQETS